MKSSLSRYAIKGAVWAVGITAVGMGITWLLAAVLHPAYHILLILSPGAILSFPAMLIYEA
jgi:hypothetical protein